MGRSRRSERRVGLVGRCPESAVRVGAPVAASLKRSGETVVTLGVGEEREVERIPKQLRRFL